MHLNGIFVTINGERHYLSLSVDHEGEVLERLVSTARDRKVALKFLKKSLWRCDCAALRERGIRDRQRTGR
ncbi:transposase [Defluviimonas sp. WL0075]|uniref:transposase n=1 Tax=Albidovulum sediminicola TaxID=2984331 RepID=UPI0021E79280|nr:transposase [Defluviimonas sp. WL0075]